MWNDSKGRWLSLHFSIFEKIFLKKIYSFTFKFLLLILILVLFIKLFIRIRLLDLNDKKIHKIIKKV